MAKFDIFPLLGEDSIKIVGIPITKEEKDGLENYCALLNELLIKRHRKEINEYEFYEETSKLKREVVPPSLKGWIIQIHSTHSRRKSDRNLVELSEIIDKTQSEVDYV